MRRSNRLQSLMLLLQSASGTTKCNRLLLPSASDITGFCILFKLCNGITDYIFGSNFVNTKNGCCGRFPAEIKGLFKLSLPI